MPMVGSSNRNTWKSRVRPRASITFGDCRRIGERPCARDLEAAIAAVDDLPCEPCSAPRRIQPKVEKDRKSQRHERNVPPIGRQREAFGNAIGGVANPAVSLCWRNWSYGLLFT